MLPEARIFGGLALFVVLGAAWILVELLFGKGTSGLLFGGLAAIIVFVFVTAFAYGRTQAVAGWIREKSWWWRGPESAIRVLLRWREQGAQDPAAVAAALRALPDWRVNARSLDGETALHAAIRLHSFLGEHLEPILEQLLAAGADPNARYEYNGDTPLDYVEDYEAPAKVAEHLRAAGAA